MRTEDVLNSIDNALEDWTVSGDAMRWTPEPEKPQRARLSIGAVGADPRSAEGWTNIDHLVNAVTWDPSAWHGAMLAQALGTAFQEAAQSLSRMFATSAEDIARMASTLADLGADLSPAEDDPTEVEDPRTRALRLRHERGTGPSRDVVHQRRPRKHLA